MLRADATAKRLALNCLHSTAEPASENWISAFLSGERLLNTTSAPSRPACTVVPHNDYDCEHVVF